MSFVQNMKLGETGHRFVMKHRDELLDYTRVVESLDTQDERIAGGDSHAAMLRMGEPEVYDSSTDWAADPNMNGMIRREIRAVVTGGIETKTVKSSLFRTNDRGVPCGTLGFELWSSDNEGWLPKYLHPERYPYDIVGENPDVVQPAVLVFLLMAYDMPFACVAFEDFSALAERLKEYGSEVGVDPENPSWDPASYGDDAIIIEAGQGRDHSLSWYVPLDRIVDLATVTMIGETVELRPDIVVQRQVKCSAGLQKERRDYLTACASGRRMEQDESFRDEFRMHVGDAYLAFSDILYDLHVLDGLDAGLYPTLGGMKEDYRNKPAIMRLKAMLECMLAAREPYERKSFLLTNAYLRERFREHGISSSTNSVQGNIVFFADCGLIGKSATIINRRETRLLAPVRWTEDVLKHAEQTAKQYKDAGVRLNALSKTDVIRARGQEIADALYTTRIAEDRRTVRQTNTYVYKVFKEETEKLITRKGYARLDEAVDNAWSRISEEQGLIIADDADPFDLTLEEEKTLEAERQYRRELRMVTDRKNQALSEIGCWYHRIRRDDRERYGVTGRTWIITKRNADDVSEADGAESDGGR
ncbi:MAG: hypothetical protein IKS31_01190 [Clostridia bacterium]|nr:hypothetical protein [Clostridia bacterium]